MRKMIVQSYHRVNGQENRGPFAGMISSNKLLYSTVTSLQVGKDTTEERQRMKEELGRELREQINKRGERDRTESSKR